MEIRINLAIVGLLGTFWALLAASSPEGVVDGGVPVGLEDHVAHHPGDREALLELSDRYLDAGHPAVVLALIHAGEGSLSGHPLVAHRLSRAYEGLGRFGDAARTARLAERQCARAFGLGDAPTGTAVPDFDCTAGEYAMLETHARAVDLMLDWGMVSAGDPRRARAYSVALRRARVASFTP
ncbi:MAG: hypothetical protein KC416_02165 [Myxococcales bacterium]|nr:hypothetical protein [Myxococcales bacterium]